MVVSVWEGGPSAAPDAARLRLLLACWRECAPDAEVVPADLGAVLRPDARVGLAELMVRDLADWDGAVAELEADELVDLVRFFAVAEAQLPGCEAGKRSPAIACARALRARGAYPSALTPWLRRHSNNRFLPYGSLLDLTKPVPARPSSEPSA